MKTVHRLTVAMGVGAALAVVAPAAILRAQQPRVLTHPAAINPTQPIGAALRPSTPALSDVDQLKHRIDALERTVLTQQAQIANLQTAERAPPGYVRGFITLGALPSLPKNDGISFWSRYP